jgi:hypothetical protein
MDEIKLSCVSKPSRPYARYIASTLPVLLLITLILFFISHQEGLALKIIKNIVRVAMG